MFICILWHVSWWSYSWEKELDLGVISVIFLSLFQDKWFGGKKKYNYNHYDVTIPRPYAFWMTLGNVQWLQSIPWSTQLFQSLWLLNIISSHSNIIASSKDGVKVTFWISYFEKKERIMENRSDLESNKKNSSLMRLSLLTLWIKPVKYLSLSHGNMILHVSCNTEFY